jgi:ribose 5-phosphate isomerase A
LREEYKEAALKLASEISKELNKAEILGLGSGSTVAFVLKQMNFNSKLCVPTSKQIELVALSVGLISTSLNKEVSITVDGADQVDKEMNMIKGGGGALLREKILINSSKKVYIIVSEEKVSKRLCENNVAVPVEVSPFGLSLVSKKLSELRGKPKVREDAKGYPFFTENGNIILDTGFEPLEKPEELESRIKQIAGVVEVGIFTRKPDKIFILKRNGTYSVMKQG